LKILIVAATKGEIAPTIDLIEKINFSKNQYAVTFLITGVGMVNTTHNLTKKIYLDKPDFCIQAGIAGSFIDKIAIGDLVNVSEDIFSELGVEDGNNFLPAHEINLIDDIGIKNDFTHYLLSEYFLDLKEVRGITVNTVHGNIESINKVEKRLQPYVESMEGAAFLKVCKEESIPCIQIRSISNKVEKRNRDNWNIPLAIKNLNDYLIQFIHSLK
jgi:futalosine hydrolase